MTIIILALNSHTRDDEVTHVKSWAATNNLQLNCAKSHEIVFRSRRLRGKAEQPAPPCPDIERVDKLTVLGVEVNSSLTADDHVSSLAYLLPAPVCCTLCVFLEVTVFPTSLSKMCFTLPLLGS